MAIDWPSNPTNGQVFQDYFWDAATGAWRGIGSPNNLGVQVADLQAGTKKIASYVSAAARNAAVTSPTESMLSYLADSDQIEFYNGSTWKPTLGLAQVTPTSVTPGGAGSSASFTAKGDISYTSCTSLIVNGVFSSRFTNYLIVWRNTFGTGNPDVTLQWSTSGTPNGAGYFRSGLRVNQSGTIQNYYSGGSSDGHVIGTGEASFNNAQIFGTITVFSPFLSETTMSICDSYGVFTPTGAQRYVTGAFHTAVSRDGFRILSSAGTLTGTFSVYGYN